MKDKTLTVTGSVNKAFEPDLIVLNIEVGKTFDSYDEGIFFLTEKTKDTKNRIASVGLKRDSLKTNDFKVEPNYEYYYDNKNERRRRFAGYRANAGFRVAFPLDNKLLSIVLSKLQESEDKITFSYQLSDIDAAKEEVMALAAKSAIRKAKIIAEASSITLGDIINIDYSVRRINVNYEDSLMSCDALPKMCGEIPEVDITPEDLHLRDEVTVVYEIR